LEGSDTSIDETDDMAFGKQSGPPASVRQVQDLLSLLQESGYTDFRDARHPLDLTQRQAGGRFTRDEAEALTDRLKESGTADSHVSVRPSPKTLVAQQLLQVAPAEQLAAELERRGWVVIAP
jgi:hypothetical protein